MSYSRQVTVSSGGVNNFQKSFTLTGAGQTAVALSVPPPIFGCTANASTNVITATAHGLTQGSIAYASVEYTGAGAMPGGLTDARSDTNAVPYYVIVASTDTIKLATSAANAQAGTAVDITSTGGAFAIVPGARFDDSIPANSVSGSTRLKWLAAKVTGGSSSAQTWGGRVLSATASTVVFAISEGLDFIVPGTKTSVDGEIADAFVDFGSPDTITAVLIFPGGALDSPPTTTTTAHVEALWD